MKFFTCPCGYHMPETSILAVTAHKRACSATPPQPVDLDAIIGGARPSRLLTVEERADLIHRVLSMDPVKLAEVMFFKPLREEMEREKSE